MTLRVRGAIVLSHDGMARRSTVRRIVKHKCECAECGGKRPNSSSLFQYGYVPDDRLAGSVDWDQRLFCSRRCREDYYAMAGRD